MGELKLENNIKLEIKDEQDTAVDSTLPDLPFNDGSSEDNVTPVADSSTHVNSTDSPLTKSDNTTVCENGTDSVVGSTVDSTHVNNVDTKYDSSKKSKSISNSNSSSSLQKDGKHHLSRSHLSDSSHKSHDYKHSSSRHHSSSKHSSCSHSSDKKRDSDRKHDHSSRRHESSSSRHDRSDRSDRSDRKHSCSRCYSRSKIKKAHIGVQCRRDRTLPKLTNQPFITTVNRCVPVSNGMDHLKYGRYMRVDTYPNGGASVVHMHQDELNHFSPSELADCAKEFFEVGYPLL